MNHSPLPKTALITGAARRIGREIALSLADKGWNIVLHYHHSEREAQELASLIKHKGRQCALLGADLMDIKGVSTLIARASAALGPLSLLVHNASVFEKQGLSGFSHENFAAHMAVNLEAPLHLTRDFASQAPQGSQVVCLLDGMQGWSMSGAYLSYALSKSGLHEAVRLLARPLAPRIRINGIALGATLEGTYDAPETFARLAEKAPLQRTTQIEDVLHALEFLLQCKGVTGQVLDISCGMGAPALLATDAKATSQSTEK